ncbi:MAG: hypothetical protein BWY83_01719 [bacterium ADurb.Bin478]|nr:MAG: hypothetical protein BWY83_01719 [bacterium ADurb.Bin478]
MLYPYTCFVSAQGEESGVAQNTPLSHFPFVAGSFGALLTLQTGSTCDGFAPQENNLKSFYHLKMRPFFFWAGKTDSSNRVAFQLSPLFAIMPNRIDRVGQKCFDHIPSRRDRCGRAVTPNHAPACQPFYDIDVMLSIEPGDVQRKIVFRAMIIPHILYSPTGGKRPSTANRLSGTANPILIHMQVNVIAPPGQPVDQLRSVQLDRQMRR